MCPTALEPRQNVRIHAGTGRRPESSGFPLHAQLGTLCPDSPLPLQGHPPRASCGRPPSTNGGLPGAVTATACPAEAGANGEEAASFTWPAPRNTRGECNARGRMHIRTQARKHARRHTCPPLPGVRPKRATLGPEAVGMARRTAAPLKAKLKFNACTPLFWFFLFLSSRTPAVRGSRNHLHRILRWSNRR